MGAKSSGKRIFEAGIIEYLGGNLQLESKVGHGTKATINVSVINIKSWFGQSLSSKELKGKVILLDFWNIRCSPCVKSLPELQKIHDAYKTKGLVVIACAGGDTEKTKEFLNKHGYNFPAGMVSNQMYLDYAIRGNPSYFLIDRNGYLVWGPEHRLPTDDELAKLLVIDPE